MKIIIIKIKLLKALMWQKKTENLDVLGFIKLKSVLISMWKFCQYLLDYVWHKHEFMTWFKVGRYAKWLYYRFKY